MIYLLGAQVDRPRSRSSSNAAALARSDAHWLCTLTTLERYFSLSLAPYIRCFLRTALCSVLLRRAYSLESCKNRGWNDRYYMWVSYHTCKEMRVGRILPFHINSHLVSNAFPYRVIRCHVCLLLRACIVSLRLIVYTNPWTIPYLNLDTTST